MTDSETPPDETERTTEGQPGEPTDGRPGQAGPDESQGRPTMSQPNSRGPGPQRGPPRQRRPPQNDDRDIKAKMIGYLFWGAFALLFLFGAWAAFGMYRNILRIIDIWVTADFQPFFRTLFNLVVVLAAVLGMSLLVRRLDVSFSPSQDE